MKNVYLTENQYVNFVLNEYRKFGCINESNFDIQKLFHALYKGCRNFTDYARRTTYIAGAGIISAALLYNIVTKILPINDNEKQTLITQVEKITNENNITKKDIINLNFNISEKGIEHIKQFEKCNLEPYYATKNEKSRGIRTIGWGHKIISTDPNWLKKARSITQEQADDLFLHDIKLYENELKSLFKLLPKNLQNVDLYPQGFIDVCVSLIYNCGMGNLKESPFFTTLAKCRVDKDGKINTDDYLFTCSKIKETCIRQRGKIVNGLVKRRQIESLMAQKNN